MKTIKTITLCIFICGLSLSSSFGQSADKGNDGGTYEFALIHFDGPAFYISYSSGQVDEVKVIKNEQSPTNQTQIMKKLGELSNKGWEVISFHGYPTTYLLRRKK